MQAIEKANPTVKDLENRFMYHPPKDGQTQRYAMIRAQILETAKLILAHTPASREQALAMTKLEEAMFWSNASIARNE